MNCCELTVEELGILLTKCKKVCFKLFMTLHSAVTVLPLPPKSADLSGDCWHYRDQKKLNRNF